MKISIIQSNPKTNDFEGNVEHILNDIKEAGKDSPDLIILPIDALNGVNFDHSYNHNKGLYERYKEFTDRVLSLNLKSEFVLASQCIKTSFSVREGKCIEAVAPDDYHIEGHMLSIKNGKKIFISSWDSNYSEFREIVPEDADLFVVLGNVGYRKGNMSENIQELTCRAEEHKKILVFANICGGNDSEIFYGNSMVISPDGTILAEAPAFEDVVLTVDTEKAVPYSPEPREDIADMANALVLGIRDFFGKQGFTKAVLGLSGGIDSAVVAALTAKAIGGENVLGVLMPSEYTSQDSIDQALELAKNLGMPHRIVPIKNIFNTLKQEIGLSDEKTENGKVSLALQNLQSRSRGIIIMALSNSEGRIAVATGNKSEIAVGYCTLYGDTVGSIAPIADLLKTEVYELAEYINHHKEIIPKGTITRPPSAELSPNQKDEDDLPPYNQLDKIVRMFVENEYSLKAIVSDGIPEDVAIKTIRRIENNEFKRRQLPMGLKIAAGISFFFKGKSDYVYTAEWQCPLVKKNLY